MQNNSQEQTPGTPQAKELKQVTAPLSMDQLKESFTNPNIMFVISLKNSSLKGHELLVYLSNLEIPAELDLSEASQQDIEELLQAYFITNSIVESTALSVMAGQVILDSIGCDSDQYYQGCFLTKAQRASFIQKNLDSINKWAQFITSSLMFGLISFPAIEEKENFKTRLPKIEDFDAVGMNIVNMFKSPGFMEIFFSIPTQFVPHYYKFQFEDHMFKGKNLFHYFMAPDNMMSVLLQAVLLTEEGAQMMVEAVSGKEVAPEKVQST